MVRIYTAEVRKRSLPRKDTLHGEMGTPVACTDLSKTHACDDRTDRQIRLFRVHQDARGGTILVNDRAKTPTEDR